MIVLNKIEVAVFISLKIGSLYMAWLRESTGAVAKVSLHKASVTAYGLEPGWSIHDQDEV